MKFRVTAAGALLLAALLACATPLERGERLYRRGDVSEALATWRAVEPADRDYEQVQARLQEIAAEFERSLRRYEKQAAFFESEDRLAEAVLYYRLALKRDPERRALLERVQTLVRELVAREREERKGLARALRAGDLKSAIRHAGQLETLNPFSPAIQVEIRQVRAATGERVMRYVQNGQVAYMRGDRERARAAFGAVLELDERNQTALGYLSYLRRFETLEAQAQIPPPPRSISEQQIVAEGHFRSATQAEEAGEPFWAIAEYEAALRIDPEHEGARTSLAALRGRLRPRLDDLYEQGKRYFQEDDLHNALRAWRRALAIDPNDARTRENVGRAERMLSRLEELQARGR